MTTIVVGDRQTGRTRRCIEQSAKTFAYIVCRSRRDVERVASEARSMGLEIPFPITFHDLIGGHFHGGNIKGFIIDDLDALTASLTRGVPVEMVTWESPDIERVGGDSSSNDNKG